MKAQKRYYLRALTVSLFIVTIAIPGCRQQDCVSGDVVPKSPYDSPVWYPDGSRLGFNHDPVLAGSGHNNGCVINFGPGYLTDSAGFWIINKDGTNLRRLTSFILNDPAWSPDGRWIAFDKGGNIYKMPFDGQNFDSTDIIQLTDSAENLFPAWSPKGDSIYFGSNINDGTQGNFRICKMSADGRGLTIIGKNGLDSAGNYAPFCTVQNQIICLGAVPGSAIVQIFMMDVNGNHVSQLTFDSNGEKQFPRLVNGKIYFEALGIWTQNTDGSGLELLCSQSNLGYSISTDGIIAYVKYDGTKVDHMNGTIWLTDTVGNNTSQLTYNNY